MPEKDWLVVDANSLCWRLFHGHAGRNAGLACLTAVIDARRYAERFHCTGIAWAFDRGPYKRALLLSSYKESRRKRTVTDDENLELEAMRSAMDRLCGQALPAVGYANVFHEPGYEADDMIAAVVQGLPAGDRAVVVSDDKDLYQLLSPRCAVFHPRSGRFITGRDFRAEYGIAPRQWSVVKSIAGCSTDDVPGVKGVGEKTALKYVRREMKGRHAAIEDFRFGPAYPLNLRLIQLPFEGLKPLPLRDDSVPPPHSWEDVCEAFGVAGLDEPTDIRRQRAVWGSE